MSRSRSFRDFWRTVFFFFTCPTAVFFRFQPFFGTATVAWNFRRRVKIAPGGRKHPSPQNCARRIWEDRGTDGRMGLLGAVPAPRRFSHCPSANETPRFLGQGGGVRGGGAGAAPPPRHPAKGGRRGSVSALLGAAPPCRPPRSPGCLHPRGARRVRTCSRTNFLAPVGMFMY